MYIDVYLETWNKGKGTHLFYLYPIKAANIDSSEIDAYGILNELINEEKGLWKDKELWEIDGAWGISPVDYLTIWGMGLALLKISKPTSPILPS